MSNKAILIAITATVIAASGIFILAKSRPADIQSNVGTSSASSSLNSVIVKNLQSSSSYSVVVSSSVAVSSIAETPKVETPPVAESKPVVQAPAYVAPQNGKGNEPIKQSPVANSTYEFSYSLIERGDLNLTSQDLNFVNENISDVAKYYFNSIKSQYLGQKIYIYANNIKKIDNQNYFIAFENTIIPQVSEGATVRSFNPKVYKLIAISDKDGEFEESNLSNLYSFPIYSNTNNNGATIAPPGFIPTGGRD
jgi:hypothetical protein